MRGGTSFSGTRNNDKEKDEAANDKRDRELTFFNAPTDTLIDHLVRKAILHGHLCNPMNKSHLMQQEHRLMQTGELKPMFD